MKASVLFKQYVWLVDTIRRAGRAYHDADLVWNDLKIGQTLRLEREPQNPYDANAIQVIFNRDGEDFLLGYIPRSENAKLVAFLDAGWEELFTCRISQLCPDAHSENQVQLTVRIRQNTKKKNN